MMENDDYMERLIGRFLDGATTNAEEKELYSFFASDTVPEHLQPYRGMFVWFEGGMADPAEQAHRDMSSRRKFRSRLAGAAAVAAGIAVAILLLRPESEREPKTYVESYIIRNGVKITDPAIVLPALEESRRYWEEVEREQRELALRMEIGPPDEFGDM